MPKAALLTRDYMLAKPITYRTSPSIMAASSALTENCQLHVRLSRERSESASCYRDRRGYAIHRVIGSNWRAVVPQTNPSLIPASA
jgi:hypothetical protein